MASLTDVSMRLGNSWIKTNPDEAWNRYPRTVQAKERLFRCNICGQYVVFAVGSKNANHFRHNSGEDNKDCEDRTKYNKDYYGNFRTRIFIPKVEKHNLPIRLSISSSKILELEIGLIPIPDNLEKKLFDSTIVINGVDTNLKYEYAFERINNETTTYLSVGSAPAEKYSINVIPFFTGLEVYWPKEIEGIPTTGCLFNEKNGKKLAYNANVKVGQTYLLLIGKIINKNNNSFFSDIKIEKVCETVSLRSKWYVYRVLANELTQTNSDFFRLFNANLTNETLDVTQIWPACIRTSESICHSAKKLFFFTYGDQIRSESKPETHIERDIIGKNHLISVDTNKSSQIVAFWNNSEMTDYQSLIYEETICSTKSFDIKITDEDNNIFEPNMHDKLPKSSILYIKSEIDGIIVVFNNDILRYKDELKANTLNQTPKLIFGDTLYIYQGLDCIWKASFESNKQLKRVNDYKSLIVRLNKCNGRYIKIDHSFANIIRYFNYDISMRSWLLKTIKKGCIKEDALKIIKSFCINSNNHNLRLNDGEQRV